MRGSGIVNYLGDVSVFKHFYCDVISLFFLCVARVGSNNPIPDIEQQAPNDLKTPA